MAQPSVLIPFDSLTKLTKDSADLEAVKSILTTKYPDETCQLLSVKAILGLVEEEVEEPEEEPIPEPEPEPDDPESTP